VLVDRGARRVGARVGARLELDAGEGVDDGQARAAAVALHHPEQAGGEHAVQRPYLQDLVVRRVEERNRAELAADVHGAARDPAHAQRLQRHEQPVGGGDVADRRVTVAGQGGDLGVQALQRAVGHHTGEAAPGGAEQQLVAEPVRRGLPDRRADLTLDTPVDAPVDALVDEVGHGTQQTPGDRTAEQGAAVHGATTSIRHGGERVSTRNASGVDGARLGRSRPEAELSNGRPGELLPNAV
jgi:hypothetical protein